MDTPQGRGHIPLLKAGDDPFGNHLNGCTGDIREVFMVFCKQLRHRQSLQPAKAACHTSCVTEYVTATRVTKASSCTRDSQNYFPKV